MEPRTDGRLKDRKSKRFWNYAGERLRILGEVPVRKFDGVSYPDGVEADDGRIYLIYDFDRRGAREILMAVFDEDDVLAGKPSETTRLRVLVNKADDP